MDRSSDETTPLKAFFEGDALHAFLNQAAAVEGFVVSGGVDLDRAFGDPERRFEQHVEHYDRWLAEGRAGSMHYLQRGRDRRADPRAVFEPAKSVFCVAVPYPRRPAGADAPAEGPRYARYLQGGDYHHWVAERLDRVMARASNESEARGAGAIRYKVCVDTSAVLERTWAALAGLGWIGKNTLLIHPKHGSYLFLGEVLLDRALDAEPRPLPDYCGNCRRCLEGCPTKAIVAPHELDSRRCTSYLTLEQRADWELPAAERAAMGPWIAGCDICQEVCPFNLKPVRAELDDPLLLSAPSINSKEDASRLKEWIALLQESESAYRDRVRDSAMKRVKPHQFRRNLAEALGSTLAELAPESRHRLAAAALPWAEERFRVETDPLAQQAWESCLQELRRFALPN